MPPRFGFVVCDAAAAKRTNCTAMPRPPLLGEVSSNSETERLYEDEAFPLEVAARRLTMKRVYTGEPFPVATPILHKISKKGLPIVRKRGIILLAAAFTAVKL